MTAEMYADFEKSFPKPILSPNADGVAAAYLLGIERVLREIRDKYVS